jgi:drug/metabolite transporter (DMT)-like permease
VQSILLALGASLSWGVGDFYGPLQGRVLGALRTLVYVELGGLAGIALLILVRFRLPHDAVVLLAIPAAVSGTLGLFAYYRGIAVGAISIVAPIAGVSAVIPVAAGIVSGESPSAWQLAGMACALLGVFLAALEPRRETETRIAAGAGFALLAAVGFGSYFPFMHAAGQADLWWSSLVFRITATAIMLVAAGVRRPPLNVPLRVLPALVLVGNADMLGNLLYAGASVGGLVSVTSVLASLYPIVTVVMARLLLAERIARSQEAGVVLVVLAVALISAG